MQKAQRWGPLERNRAELLYNPVPPAAMAAGCFLAPARVRVEIATGNVPILASQGLGRPNGSWIAAAGESWLAGGSSHFLPHLTQTMRNIEGLAVDLGETLQSVRFRRSRRTESFYLYLSARGYVSRNSNGQICFTGCRIAFQHRNLAEREIGFPYLS